MADLLTYEERKALRRAAEDARDAANPHYGPFVDLVAHPLNILALLDMADRAALAQDQDDAGDPLQGAASWLSKVITECTAADIRDSLMIGHNRAQRLLDAARAAKEK
jgi:hypothetical protein